MKQTGSTLRNALFAAVVAAALATGTRAAVAAPKAVAACGDPDQACIVSAQCIGYCFPRGGICNQGCCACLR